MDPGLNRFYHVLIRHLSPWNSCVLGDGSRSHCAFLLLGYPHRGGHERGVRPRKYGGIAPADRFRSGKPECVIRSGGRARRLSPNHTSRGKQITGPDASRRFRRMSGFSVRHPIRIVPPQLDFSLIMEVRN